MLQILLWIALGVAAWFSVACVVGVAVGRLLARPARPVARVSSGRRTVPSAELRLSAR